MGRRRIGPPALTGLLLFAFLLLAAVSPTQGRTAPFAAMVQDARTGQVLYAENADAQLHPASLTKMMTLWIAFEAVERGEIGLDTMVTVPSAAAAEPPSKLGLHTGQQIRFRYLLRAAAVKSANDAATAIGFAISGSEEAFAARMNRTAQAMGMSRTHFKNAHGLTEVGHMSTARDMTLLGRHIIYDWPQYYNLFSRITTDAGVRKVSHTNRRFLQSYQGADGIKTGYTNAAGFNLVATAERGSERVITTVFGGASTTARNRKVAELMDVGFSKAPTRAALHRPAKPPYLGNSGIGTSRVRANGAVLASLRPATRPLAAADLPQMDAAGISAAVAAAVNTSAPAPSPVGPAPALRPETLASAAQPEEQPAQKQRIVSRVSTNSGRHWGINVGRYNSQYQAERVLMRVALNEVETLDGTLRKVSHGASGFDANFMGMTRDAADRACRRLQARGTTCFMIQPGG